MHALKFAPEAWEDYLYWQNTDKAILKRINCLIKEVLREPYLGTGKPEALKHELSGWWSRRVTDEHRLVYRFAAGTVEIAKIRYHY